MKTFMTICSENDYSELKFDTNSFFLTKKELSQRKNTDTNGTFKSDEIISTTTLTRLV